MTPKPKADTSPTSEGKGQFVQAPLHLIYGLPGLTRDDKWVLLSIMGKCWEEGKRYKLSFREIESISGVPVSLLSSYTSKKTGTRREGIIDRIVRVTSYLIVTLDKEIDEVTGRPRKQAQMYIALNYTRIWQDNSKYCSEKRVKSVSHANTLQQKEKAESVSHANATVSHANTSVLPANGSVSYANGSVRNVSVNSPPYITLDYLDNQITLDSNSDAASADITGTPSSLSSDSSVKSEERDHPDLQSLEGENADGDMAHPGLAPQSGWSAVFSSSCVHATGMESGRVETEAKPDEASATLQTSAQTQTVVDSYSQPSSEETPPVSLSEQNTAISITSGQHQGEVSAADENEYHSQFDSVENVPEWAQGATNGTGIDNDYSAVSSHPGGTNRDGARASRVASGDGQPGAVQHATGGNHTARSVAARSEVDDGSMGTGCGRDTGTLSDPARSNGGHQSRAGAREPEAAHDQRSSALGESAQSAGHCEPADLLRRNAGGQRGAGRAGTVKDEAVGTDKGNKGAGRKAKKDHPLSPEERERWRKWKKIIMDNRGGELQDQGKIINEAEEIKKVLARFNDAQLHTIWWYMTTQHFKWSKPDFKHTIGGYALNHEANGIKKTLEELRKWPEDSVPGKPLSPDTWETTPPLVRSGTGYQNMNAKMAAMAKQFALVPRGE